MNNSGVTREKFVETFTKRGEATFDMLSNAGNFEKVVIKLDELNKALYGVEQVAALVSSIKPDAAMQINAVIDAANMFYSETALHVLAVGGLNSVENILAKVDANVAA